MAPPNTLVNKLKVQLKMAIQRLRMHQSKATAIAKQQRRHMAELLASGKLESARIRVEGIIRSDITTELHEILELYCELLLARIALLEPPYTAHPDMVAEKEQEAAAAKGKGKGAGSGHDSVASRIAGALTGHHHSPPPPAPAAGESPAPPAVKDAAAATRVDPTLDMNRQVISIINLPDQGLVEAIIAVMYAAPRLGPDVKELTTARALLAEKLGKDVAFKINATSDPHEALCMGVPERVLKRLSTKPPSPALVDGYLREIGRTYGVRWGNDPEEEEEDEEGVVESVEGHGGLLPDFDDEDEDKGGDGGGGGGGGGQRERPIAITAQELSRATPPREVGAVAPLRIAPPSPSTENVAPKLKLPPRTANSSSEASASSAGAGPAPSSPLAGRKKKPAAAVAPPPLPPASSGAAAGAGAAASARKDGPGGKVPDVDELAKRFEALKRL